MLTLVYGYGTSGKSAVKCLLRLGRQVAVFADKYIAIKDKKVINRSGMDVDSALDDVSLVVVSPSVSLDSELLTEAKKRGVEVVGELELGYRNLSGDIIAITGTNGKTSCTELVTQMLKNANINADFYGNIGVPLAENSNLIDVDKVAVVEVSSFQLATIELFCPKIAMCLNVAEDHLEYHKNMENYIACKKRIFENQDKSEYAILNYDDEIVRQFSKDISSTIYYFSLKHKVRGCYLVDNNIYFYDERPEFVCAVNDIAIKGEHNIANCLACITACKILNMPNNVIVKTLQEYELSAHRLQLVNTINDVKYFDDSKSTNILSTLSACRAIKGKTTLLIGGYDKGLDHRKLFEELPDNVCTIICFGDNKDKIVREYKSSNKNTLIRAENLEDAIVIASKVKCENVLFSPATSSFDRFENYIERGNYFREFVMRIKN